MMTIRSGRWSRRLRCKRKGTTWSIQSSVSYLQCLMFQNAPCATRHYNGKNLIMFLNATPVSSSGPCNRYLIFYMQGIGCLVPWNAFITTTAYWNATLSETSFHNGVGMSQITPLCFQFPVHHVTDIHIYSDILVLYLYYIQGCNCIYLAFS